MCDEYQLPESAILYLDSNRGIYIPRDFFQVTKPECINWHCSEESKAWILEQCANPDSEGYWDAWNDAEAYQYVTVTDPNSDIEYYLYQDGDVWLIPKGE